MSHEISEVMIGGRQIVEAMYANNPAWHGLGVVFDKDGKTAPNSEQAIELAHLDWTVEKEQFTLIKDGPEAKAVANHYALVRQDTRDVLHMVGNEYKPLQNREGFKFLDSLLMDEIMTYESAFALNGGQRVVLLARMPSIDYVTADDAMIRYIMFLLHHGGGSIIALPTSVRVVCANTVRLALTRNAGKFTIQHSGNLEAKLEGVRKHLSQLDKAFTLHADKFRKLAETRYTPDQAREYIAAVLPAPQADASDRKKTIHERRIQDIRARFASPAQLLPSIRGTWWAMYNAVTEAVDHGNQSSESKDPTKRMENRFNRVIDGQGADFKDLALTKALEMAA